MIPLALQPPDINLRLRPVSQADVVTLRRTCWPARELESVQRLVIRAQHLAQQGYGLGVVALAKEGAPIGYGQLTMWPKCAEISDLMVTESLRGQGIGTAIIQYLMRAAREMNIGCVEIGAQVDNPRALALYRRLGFDDHHILSVELDNVEVDVIYLRLETTGQSF